jgi:hypothetical protein
MKKALYQALETVQDEKDHIGLLLFIYLFLAFLQSLWGPLATSHTRGTFIYLDTW